MTPTENFATTETNGGHVVGLCTACGWVGAVQQVARVTGEGSVAANAANAGRAASSARREYERHACGR